MGEAMGSSDRNQITITLSEQALKEFRLVARWLGMSPATLMRQKLEEAHQSPAFGNLVKRAKAKADVADDDDQED